MISRRELLKTGSLFLAQAALPLHLLRAADAGPVIAGVQMEVTKDVRSNEKRLLAAIRQASTAGAKFLATPEGSLSGYYSGFDQRSVERSLKRVVDSAREHGLGLFLGTCFTEKAGSSVECYNQVRVYTPAGEYLGFHAKILRCSTSDDPYGGEVKEYATKPLGIFQWNGISFGVLICNDLWATPEFTQMPDLHLVEKLKSAGADVIIHCINSGTDQKYRAYHESRAESLASEFQIPIVEVNAAGAEGLAVNAQSGVIDAYGKREVAVVDQGDQFFTWALSK